MERSNFSCRTNYRNIQEPGSAESISSRSLNLFPSVSLALAVFQLFIPPPPPHSLFFFFFHFILRSQWGYYWWGTSCSKFSFSVQMLSLHHHGAVRPFPSIKVLFVPFWYKVKLEWLYFLLFWNFVHYSFIPYSMVNINFYLIEFL